MLIMIPAVKQNYRLKPNATLVNQNSPEEDIKQCQNVGWNK